MRSSAYGAAGLNRGGVVERRFPARTQGRTVGRTLAGGADHSLTSVQVSFKDKPTGFTAFALVGDVVSKVSWCFRGRVKPDLLALLAQSQASRGLAPEALSAQLAVSTCLLKLSKSLASQGLAPEALSSQLSVSTCSLKLVQSLASRGLAPEAFADQLAVSTCSIKLAQSLASRGLAPDSLSAQLTF